MGHDNPLKARPIERLSPLERELLGLLAQGHTAKTIAELKQMSVAAVNERFRAARRKTGLGSSREVARLLLPPENRDDFIDLVPRPGVGSVSKDGRRTIREPVFDRWRGAMIIGSLLAAVLAAHEAPQIFEGAAWDTVPQASAGADPVARLAAGPDFNHLQTTLRTEERDERWSPQTEAAVESLYRGAPNFPYVVERFSVACSRSLCEVVGSTRAGASTAEVRALVADVQGRVLNEAIAGLGLSNVTIGFTSSEASPSVASFVAYWSRNGAT